MHRRITSVIKNLRSSNTIRWRSRNLCAPQEKQAVVRKIICWLCRLSAGTDRTFLWTKVKQTETNWFQTSIMVAIKGANLIRAKWWGRSQLGWLIEGTHRIAFWERFMSLSGKIGSWIYLISNMHFELAIWKKQMQNCRLSWKSFKRWACKIFKTRCQITMLNWTS